LFRGRKFAPKIAKSDNSGSEHIVLPPPLFEASQQGDKIGRNFRLLVDCVYYLAIFLITEGVQNFGLLFSREKVLLLKNKLFGRHFGRFRHELIWSLCQPDPLFPTRLCFPLTGVV
jgi:hypothetical protein